MPTVRIGSITEGLVLSCDVKDLNGRLLLRQGVVISDRHIKLFKSWGVTEVEVVSLPTVEVSSAQLTPEEKAAFEMKSSSSTELMNIFARNDLNHPMIRELFEICVARKAKQPW